MPDYDSSHRSYVATDCGHLQTISCIPVCAGDRMGLDAAISVRLAPLRQFLISDAYIDVFAFYQPWRHCYGDDFIQFMLDGERETVTFPTATAGSLVSYFGAIEVGTFALWPVNMYANIWNRYFRDPTNDSDLMSTTAPLQTTNERTIGKLCGRLKTPWSTGLNKELVDANREVDTSGGSFDLADMALIKAQYKTDVERQWYGQRYNDVLREFGGKANADADQRPTLLKRSQYTLSGYDVDGTGDDSLGQYSGKAIGMNRFGFPTKYFPEHGAVMIMILVRMPLIMKNEVSHLIANGQPSYKELSGDPDLYANTVAEVQDLSLWFRDGGSVNEDLCRTGSGGVISRIMCQQRFNSRLVLVF